MVELSGSYDKGRVRESNMKGEQQNPSASYYLTPVCTPRWATEVETGMVKW